MDSKKVCISPGNIKMGSVSSVSLPPSETCDRYPCRFECYARRMETYRKTVKNANYRNFDILKSDPTSYWAQVEAAIVTAKYFRFHVSGDIPNMDYLAHMTKLARRYKNTQILCFTKKYKIVNEFLDSHTKPKNLHLILSFWRGFNPPNPHRLPECHVRFKDGYCGARSDAEECGGNCTTCAQTGRGCWNLKRGQQIVINEH